jgi:hypothetical protein
MLGDDQPEIEEEDDVDVHPVVQHLAIEKIVEG